MHTAACTIVLMLILSLPLEQRGGCTELRTAVQQVSRTGCIGPNSAEGMYALLCAGSRSPPPPSSHARHHARRGEQPGGQRGRKEDGVGRAARARQAGAAAAGATTIMGLNVPALAIFALLCSRFARPQVREILDKRADAWAELSAKGHGYNVSGAARF